MRAAIHSQYLDTLGGGERYLLGVVKTLINLGYDVDLEWPNASIIKKLEDRFGVKLTAINVVPDVKRGDGYDVCFWVSDGSVPTLRARKNLLHFQTPFHHMSANNLLNKMKLFRIDHIICNSEFTKKIIDFEYGVDSVVVYPPVDVEKIKTRRKENLIVYIGRFSKLVQVKGHDTLIDGFKTFLSSGDMSDWKLVFAGGSEVGTGDYLNNLRKTAKDLPIEFMENVKYSDLCSLYGSAKFFWSASGFGVDKDNYPEKMEHFGISTVEAMAGGAVPIVFRGGGQSEIVTEGVDGFLWDIPSELVEKTKELIKDKHRYRVVSNNARLNAAKFSDNQFENKFRTLL